MPPDTPTSRKRPLTAGGYALSSLLIAGIAIYLFAIGRWHVVAWFMLISALMTGIPATYDVLKGRGTKR
jgi:hypothetical protein